MRLRPHFFFVPANFTNSRHGLTALHLRQPPNRVTANHPQPPPQCASTDHGKAHAHQNHLHIMVMQ